MKIIDAHIHLYDAQANSHSFLNETDTNLVEFVGDYATLPRRYFLENYQQDCQPYRVDGAICYEFISSDAVKEARWINHLIDSTDFRLGLVALVDFLDPQLQHKLEIYNTLTHVKAVREHMVWDDNNPKKRFAARPDLLSDTTWLKNLELLKANHFKCELEVFAPQLPDLVNVAKQYPDINFLIPAMGWPLDLSAEGFQQWKKYLTLASQCENLSMKIHGLECIFGMQWTIDQIKPWLLTTIECFGTTRCMLGSHMPIAKLSRSFSELYRAYETIFADYSAHEKENLFYQTAQQWFEI